MNTTHETRIQGDEFESTIAYVNDAVSSLNTAHGSVRLDAFSVLEGTTGDFEADFRRMDEFIQQKRHEVEVAESYYYELRAAINDGVLNRYREHIDDKYSKEN